MPRRRTIPIDLSVRDFKRGILSGVSERGVKHPDWLAGADNMYGRPYKAMRIRPGSRDISSGVLSDAPHSLMGFYASGGNKLFVGAGNQVFEATATDYTAQTLPASHPANTDIITHTNLDGILAAVQRAGALTPLMYDGAWKELKLPAPPSAVTFAADDNTGGVVDVGTHYFRVRWRHAHGSSIAGPISAARVVAAPNQTVHLATGLLPASPRSDFVGWTLEMTKVNGSTAGPWWFVADGVTSTYAVATRDSLLGYRADEGLHGEPPHFDGITSFAGRLWGWTGSTLRASQTFDGLEATGIANWDADLTYPIAKDDGDTLQVCLVVLDELLILKRRSVHVISGVDPESFVLTPVVYADPERGSEAGCAGPRAACVIGGKAYFWGESGGLFTYSRGEGVKPAGWIEMGRYLDELNTGELDKLLLINHQGNYMLGWYPPGSSTHASEQLVLDARLKQWWHWKGWTARAAIELKGGLFNNASMVFADPTNRAYFGDVPNAASMSGPGIQAGTTVAGAVSSGATTLAMSKVATLDQKNVSLTINGSVVSRCNTTLGSAVVTVSEYHLWAAFDFFKDEKAASSGGSGSGSGGAGLLPSAIAVAFTTKTLGANPQVYAQDLAVADGAAQWAAGGVLASVNGALAAQECITVSDDNGGFIVVWKDSRSGNADIYAQRFAFDGTALWAAGGVAVNAAAGAQALPVVIADGAGGAIIAWHDDRGANRDIYAQRIGPTGSLLWSAGGVVICAATGGQNNPVICSDGAGGAIIAWADQRTASTELYAQRVNNAGTVQWTANGVLVYTHATKNVQFATDVIDMLADGSGGATISFRASGGGVQDVRIQRIDSAGAVQWGADGTLVETFATGFTLGNAVLTKDASTGVIVVYSSAVTSTALLAKRYNAAGVFQWSANIGVASTVKLHKVVSDDAGGAIVILGTSSGGTQTIKAQRVDGAGALQWNAGAPITIVSVVGQTYASALAKDGVGGCVIAWQSATGSDADTFATRVTPNGAPMWGPSGVVVRSPSVTTTSPVSNIAIAVGFSTVSSDPPFVPASGGRSVAFLIESPWLDGGLPDDWKDLDFFSFTSEGDAIDLSVAISTDPAGNETAVSLSAGGQGNDWADAANPADNDLEWDVGDWAASAPSTIPTGIQSGTIARRFKFSASGAADGDFRPTEMSPRAILLPDVEYDR